MTVSATISQFNVTLTVEIGKSLLTI